MSKVLNSIARSVEGMENAEGRMQQPFRPHLSTNS